MWRGYLCMNIFVSEASSSANMKPGNVSAQAHLLRLLKELWSATNGFGSESMNSQFKRFVPMHLPSDFLKAWPSNVFCYKSSPFR